MRRLFLHIGSGKTGTTTLRNFLASNEERLHAHRLHYVNLPCLDAAHMAVALHSPERRQVIGQFLRTQLDDLAQYPADDVIAIDEGLLDLIARMDATTLTMALDTLSCCAITFVYYLRRPDDLLKSSHAQARSFTDHPEFSRKSYRDAVTASIDARNAHVFPSAPLARLIAAAGRRNVVIRRYDRESLTNGDIIEDLFAVMGRKVPAGTVRPCGAATNPSIPTAAIPLLSPMLWGGAHADLLDVDDTLLREVLGTLRHAHSPAMRAAARGEGIGEERTAALMEEIKAMDALVPGYAQSFAARPLSIPFDEGQLPSPDAEATQALLVLVLRRLASQDARLDRICEAMNIDAAGIPLARRLHAWAHRQGIRAAWLFGMGETYRRHRRTVERCLRIRGIIVDEAYRKGVRSIDGHPVVTPAEFSAQDADGAGVILLCRRPHRDAALASIAGILADAGRIFVACT
jgi:hypothetical protein